MLVVDEREPAGSGPQFPALFAPFASVLQENRGGHVPLSVTEIGNRNTAIEVTDGAGKYRAMFFTGTFPRPSTLTQHDLDSNKATVWVIDPRDGSIVPQPGGSDAIQTTYSSSTIAVGPGMPGSFSSADEALQDLAKTDPDAAEHLRRLIDEQFGGQWPPPPPDISPPTAT